MRFIGITGGVGAGKSELLHYIEREFSAKILLADELAHKLMQPGTECYAQIREAFPDAELYLETGSRDFFRCKKAGQAEWNCPSGCKTGDSSACGGRTAEWSLFIFYSGGGIAD